MDFLNINICFNAFTNFKPLLFSPFFSLFCIVWLIYLWHFMAFEKQNKKSNWKLSLPHRCQGVKHRHFFLFFVGKFSAVNDESLTLLARILLLSVICCCLQQQQRNKIKQIQKFQEKVRLIRFFSRLICVWMKVCVSGWKLPGG